MLFFTAQLMLTAYQNSLAAKTGVAPGSEMKKAINLADETGAKLITIDRNISVTLKRAWMIMGAKEKLSLLMAMFSPKNKNINAEEIERLKNSDALTAIIDEFKESAPQLKRVILDERDIWMASKLKKKLGAVTVAVVGAAHVPGILKALSGEITDKQLRAMEYIPPQSKLSKAMKWVFPAIIVIMLASGFLTGHAEVTGKAALYWTIITGALSALGCAIALGHPFTILSGFLAAPFTTINPLVGAGMITGLVQVFFVRPTVLDFENVSKDTMKIKGWWKNRLARAMLVSIFSSIGAAIGTFIGIPVIAGIVM